RQLSGPVLPVCRVAAARGPRGAEDRPDEAGRGSDGLEHGGDRSRPQGPPLSISLENEDARRNGASYDAHSPSMTSGANALVSPRSMKSSVVTSTGLMSARSFNAAVTTNAGVRRKNAPSPSPASRRS